MAGQTEINNLALFCDFENIALGVRESRYANFDIRRVLERLLLKGSIVVKKAYCDWDRYKDFKRPMHEASFELIEIPHVRQSGKNSADIRMVVDALDLCYTKAHVDAFVIISGDSDFSPLVSKLRENNKYVIGIGVRDSTSDLLAANCDEFIFYDDLVREARPPSRTRKPVARAAATTEDAKSTVAKRPARKSTVAKSPGEESPPETTPALKSPAEESPAAKSPAVKRPAAKSATTATTKTPAAKTRRSRKSAAEADDAKPEPRDDDAGPGETAIDGERIESGESHERGERHERNHDDDRRHEALDLLVETIEALAAERGDDERLWGSMVKQTMKRRRPGFNESSYGYKSFRELVDDAAQRNLLIVVKDERPGQYALRLPAS